MVYNLGFFTVSAFIFIITPGLDTLFIANKAISEGKRVAIIAALGICVGLGFHIALAAWGISGLIAKTPMAYNGIKIFGGLYLLYLAYQAARTPALKNSEQNPGRPLAKQKNIFFQGVFTNISNPKVILFFIAFFPQFLKLEDPDVGMGFLQLGLIYVGLSVLWLTVLIQALGAFSDKLLQDAKKMKMVNVFAGVSFAILGVNVLLS